MIKVTLEELRSAAPSLTRIHNQKLPYKDAVRFSRFTKKINEELKTYQEHMIAYLRENAKELSDGIYEFSNPEKSNQDIKDMGSDVIELNFDKFNLPDYIELHPNDIQFLSPFINFEE